jgi:hypothetical protein
VERQIEPLQSRLEDLETSRAAATVAKKPARAGIDPRHLLSGLRERDNNSKPVTTEK